MKQLLYLKQWIVLVNESEKKDSPSQVSLALPKAEEIGEERAEHGIPARV